MSVGYAVGYLCSRTQGILCSLILGSGGAAGTFTSNDPASATTQSYMAFVLAFVALTSFIVSRPLADPPNFSFAYRDSSHRHCTELPQYLQDDKDIIALCIVSCTLYHVNEGNRGTIWH